MRLPCLSPFMVWPPLLVRRAPCHAVGLLHHGQASSGGGVAPGRRVCPGAQRVDAAAYVGCALGMNGPAGAIVAGCGVTASSGARRSVARSRRSPVAPPCLRSPTTTSGKPVCAAVGGLVSAARGIPKVAGHCPQRRPLRVWSWHTHSHRSCTR